MTPRSRISSYAPRRMTDDEVRAAAADLISAEVRDYKARHALLHELATAPVVRKGKAFGIVLPSLAGRDVLDARDPTHGFLRLVLADTQERLDEVLAFC